MQAKFQKSFIYFAVMDKIMTAFFLGICCAVISVAIIVVMSKEPILNWWFRLGAKVGITVKEGREVERWYYRPIWGCEKCFAGQIALWVYLFMHIDVKAGAEAVFFHGAVIWVGIDRYSLFHHVATVSSAIVATVFISSLINKITNEDRTSS